MQDKTTKKRYPYLWAVLYGVLLTGFTIFTLLDAFVLPRDMVYLEDVTDDRPAASKTAPTVTDTSYESEGISIHITTQRQYNTQIYIADVTIKEISYLRAGLAGGAFGRNIKETTSKMAEDNEAVLAVNGDYYGFRNRGFVMRNGYLYRDSVRTKEDDEAFVVYKDGHTETISENETDVQALAQEAVHIFSFGPGLVGEGDVLVNKHSEVERAMRSNPRTAIGEISPLHYILVVSDGRTEESEGLSLWELAQFMQKLGCRTAYNLDGGGSSAMWFMGRIVNHPTNGWRSGERRVSDIVYIGE